MKRIFWIFVLVMVCFSDLAFAGIKDSIIGILGGVWQTALAFVITAIIGLAAVAKYTPWLSKLLIVAGALLTTTGLAIEDSKVTKDELKNIIEDVKDLKDAALSKIGNSEIEHG